MGTHNTVNILFPMFALRYVHPDVTAWDCRIKRIPGFNGLSYLGVAIEESKYPITAMIMTRIIIITAIITRATQPPDARNPMNSSIAAAVAFAAAAIALAATFAASAAAFAASRSSSAAFLAASAAARAACCAALLLACAVFIEAWVAS